MDNEKFYIKSVSIRGLFGYKDIDWDLHKNVNILGGINGSGKSTILRCVNFILKNGGLNEKLAKILLSITIKMTNDYVLEWSNKYSFDCNLKSNQKKTNNNSCREYKDYYSDSYMNLSKTLFDNFLLKKNYSHILPCLITQNNKKNKF